MLGFGGQGEGAKLTMQKTLVSGSSGAIYCCLYVMVTLKHLTVASKVSTSLADQVP